MDNPARLDAGDLGLGQHATNRQWRALNVLAAALVISGVLHAAGIVDRTALHWHADVWDLWFLVLGILLALATIGTRQQSASTDHLIQPLNVTHDHSSNPARKRTPGPVPVTRATAPLGSAVTAGLLTAWSQASPRASRSSRTS
jgi:hypothetical protein